IPGRAVFEPRNRLVSLLWSPGLSRARTHRRGGRNGSLLSVCGPDASNRGRRISTTPRAAIPTSATTRQQEGGCRAEGLVGTRGAFHSRGRALGFCEKAVQNTFGAVSSRPSRWG